MEFEKYNQIQIPFTPYRNSDEGKGFILVNNPMRCWEVKF